MLTRFVTITACALLLAGSSPVRAQTWSHPKQEVPNWDLYAGYSYMFNSFYSSTGGGMTGWDASLKVPIFGSLLGIKGDVSGFNKKDGPNINSKNMFFLVGPQVGMHISTSTVWLHGLIGSAHLNNSVTVNPLSNTTLAVAVGAGLDAGMSRHLAWRVTGDFYNTHYHSTSNNLGEIKNSTGRFCTGPLFRF